MYFFIANSLYFLSPFRQSKFILLFVCCSIFYVMYVEIDYLFINSGNLVISGSPKDWLFIIPLNLSSWFLYNLNIFIFLSGEYNTFLFHFLENMFFLFLVLSLMVLHTIVNCFSIFQEQRNQFKAFIIQNA